MILCDYGCGKEAIHQFKNGKWCCSKYTCQCNNIRSKNSESNRGRKLSPESIEKVRKSKTGDMNPMKRIDVRNKVRNSLKGKCYHTKERRERSRQRMLNGGSTYMNSFPIKGFSNRKEFCKYINSIPRDPITIKNAVEKNRKIKEEKGMWTKRKDLSNWNLYQRIVWDFTNISAKEKYSKEELKQRGKQNSLNHKQLDHNFSVLEGFKLGILPSIIGSKSNIRLVSCKYNSSKQSKCDITLKELYTLIDKEKIE
jgi:hypothetical protein